jgi:general secretion pathway protein K
MSAQLARISHQRGLVLITAVLVVAIVATVATYLALGQQVWLRQTENLNDRAQADSLRQAALAWTGILLMRDDKTIDHLDELWAKQLPPLPAEGGLIVASLRDAQGLFNLNNLIKNDGPSSYDIGVFKGLLNAQDIDPALAQPLVDALTNWMDTNSDSMAEDVDYLASPHPYRVANQLLTSVDELRLVKGFSPEIVEKLRPLVTVLPGSTAVNVNTANQKLLAAMFPNLAAPTLQTFVENRKDQPYKGLSDLPPGMACPPNACDIKTDYFLVNIGVRIGRLERRSEALIQRKNQKSEMLWHRLNPQQPELKTDENS